MTISQYRRKRIYITDKHECVYCATPINLTIDHLIPKALGGTHATINLVTACNSCNLEKGSRVATPESLRFGRFRKRGPSKRLANILRNAFQSLDIPWGNLQKIVTPTAQNIIVARYGGPWGYYQLEELVNIGMLGIIDAQALSDHPKAQRSIAKRAIWDYIIRTDCPVSLPVEADQRKLAAQQVCGSDIGDTIQPFYGPMISYEEAMIFGVDLAKQIREMTDRPRQLWALKLMGYTVSEISGMTKLSKTTISTAMSRSKPSSVPHFINKTRTLLIA